MKQITGIIKTITAYRKQLADIEKRIDNASNVRVYDELVAERQIALYDLQSTVAELNRLIEIQIQCNADIMSNEAHELATREFINRANNTTR